MAEWGEGLTSPTPHTHVFSLILFAQGSIGFPGPLAPLGEKGKRVSRNPGVRGEGRACMRGTECMAVRDSTWGPRGLCLCLEALVCTHIAMYNAGHV